MPYKDPVKQKAFQLNQIHKRRTEWIERNGPCKSCGSSENLEIDHIDPTEKKISIGSIWSRKESVRNSELKKCQILCSDCHLKKTKKFYADRRKHGTHTMYKFGCRCEECRKAHRDVVNNWRWETGRRKRRGA